MTLHDAYICSSDCSATGREIGRRSHGQNITAEQPADRHLEEILRTTEHKISRTVQASLKELRTMHEEHTSDMHAQVSRVIVPIIKPEELEAEFVRLRHDLP